jgi:glycosyltransferase involved in cell wall biosynthesis
VVDEIIIVDGYSTDKTVDICKEYTDKIYLHKFSGSFAVERNFSISKAIYDWILVIDGDETLSENLQNNLEDLVQQNGYNAHAFARRNYYDENGEKWTKYAYFPDYQIRLFKKDKASYNRTVCEGADVDGITKYEPYELYINHYVPNQYSYSNFRNHIIRSAKIQSKWAEERIKPKAYYILKLPFIFFYHFFIMIFVYKWYLDGIIGFKAAFTMSLYFFMVNYYIVFSEW